MPPRIPQPSPARPLPLALFFPLIFAAVYLAHWPLLHLPYFWDEGGYYIPAALDFLRTGSLIPHSTLTNAHPPLPSILLAAWWRLGGFTVWSTRVLVVLVASAALLAVYRLGCRLLNPAGAVALTVLTALYPVWFAQSTLAHADIFAAAFTLWALSVYFEPNGERQLHLPTLAILFSLAVLAKETAIVTPVALALLELSGWRRARNLALGAALLFPVLPLAAWYAYHHHATGFIFGNPEFLRYNATANLSAGRILLSLWHRTIHLTLHMGLYVPVLSALAIWPAARISGEHLKAHSRPVLWALAAILLGNAVAFSVLGGALLTRYLLPLYPLVLLLCIAQWQGRVRRWGWLAGATALVFLVALRVNPPYAFAPEDNLAYADMIRLQQGAIAYLDQHDPAATVLSAWPATAELEHPELGYTRTPIRSVLIQNFSPAEIEKAAQEPGSYDMALVFSTKLAPAPGSWSLSRRTEGADTRLFDFHRDLLPAEIAARLHGDIVWQAQRNGQWAAVLRFPRSNEARLTPTRPQASWEIHPEAQTTPAGTPSI